MHSCSIVANDRDDRYNQHPGPRLLDTDLSYMPLNPIHDDPILRIVTCPFLLYNMPL